MNKEKQHKIYKECLKDIRSISENKTVLGLIEKAFKKANTNPICCRCEKKHSMFESLICKDCYKELEKAYHKYKVK